jgi:origin recognition complex subunit 6
LGLVQSLFLITFSIDFKTATMPTQIEQALITLVPTLNSLPQELVDLSTSLLAQSRNKASSLKPEEEIGRTYACAHIAVERLKNRLDVDKVVARPPVAPRIYKKLYGYLDAALKEPATPRTNRLTDVGTVWTPGSGRGRRSVLGTPSKTPAKSVKSAGVTPLKTPASVAKSADGLTASGRRTRSVVKATEPKEEDAIPNLEEATQEDQVQDEEKDHSLPDQVRPMAEAVCDALDVPQATPHVCAAMSAILKLRGWNDTKPETVKTIPRASAKKRKRTSTDANDIPTIEDSSSITPTSLPALIIAISLMTTFTLRNTVIDGTTYATARSSAITALESDAPLPKDVDTFLHASKTEGWLELPWFTTVKASVITSIPQAQTPKKNKPPAKTPLHRKEKHAPRPVAKDAEMDTVMEDVDAEAEEEDNDKPGAGLRSGLGTMFQDSVDWLSGEKRKAYRTWEQSVKARCAEMKCQA